MSAMRRIINQITEIINLKTSLLVGMSFVLSTVLNYSFQILSGRYLGSDKYGLLAGLIAVMSVTTVGLSAFQIQTAKVIATGKTQLPPKMVDRQFINVTKVGFFGSLLLLGLAPFASYFWNVGLLPIIFVCVYVVPAAWDSIAAGRFQGGKNFVGLAGYNFAQSAMKMLSLLLVVVVGLGVTSIVGLLTISATAVALLGLRRTKNLGTSNIRGFDSETRRIIGTNALFWMMLSMDVIIAHHALGPDAGKYAAASTISKALLWTPALVIQILFPHLASRNLLEVGMSGLIRKGALTTLLIAGSSALVLSFIGPTMVESLYGDSFDGAGQGLWNLCFALVPFSISQFLISVHFVNGHAHLLRVLLLMATIEAVALFVLGTNLTSFSVILGVTGVVLTATLVLFGDNAKAFSFQKK
jgi:O-antigen/teichoic acid export membrane protein